MHCDELLRLLNAERQDGSEDIFTDSCIAAHVRLCPRCCHGIVELSETPGIQDGLTCDQCRLRFPAYYEATRSEYPLVEMTDREIVEVALHLGRCSSCQEEYEELALLSELEERDEMLDP